MEPKIIMLDSKDDYDTLNDILKSIKEPFDAQNATDSDEKHESLFEESEEDLAFSKNESDDELVWTYVLQPTKASIPHMNALSKVPSGIANITILFRGNPETGILSTVSAAYLTLNDKVLDVACMQVKQKDKRVATFAGFSLKNPFWHTCMSETDQLKIYIRFLEPPTEPKTMIRILGDLVWFETQNLLVETSWTRPLNFDMNQFVKFDFEKRVLTIEGDMSDVPHVLAEHASKGWPHNLCNEDSEDENENESGATSTSSSTPTCINKDNNRFEQAVAAMRNALYARGRAYSEDEMYIQKLFLNEKNEFSSEAAALCAKEIARWRAQKDLLKDEFSKLHE